jgi:hypothetical protein
MTNEEILETISNNEGLEFDGKNILIGGKNAITFSKKFMTKHRLIEILNIEIRKHNQSNHPSKKIQLLNKQ